MCGRPWNRAFVVAVTSFPSVVWITERTSTLRDENVWELSTWRCACDFAAASPVLRGSCRGGSHRWGDAGGDQGTVAGSIHSIVGQALGSFKVARDKWQSVSWNDERHRSDHEYRVLCRALQFGAQYDDINVRRWAASEYINRHNSCWKKLEGERSGASALSATFRLFVAAVLDKETAIEKAKGPGVQKCPRQKPRAQRGSMTQSRWSVEVRVVGDAVRAPPR